MYRYNFFSHSLLETGNGALNEIQLFGKVNDELHTNGGFTNVILMKHKSYMNKGPKNYKKTQ